MYIYIIAQDRKNSWLRPWMEDAKMGCLWTCRWPFRFIFEPMVRRGFTVIQAEDDLSPLNKLGLLH
jgi:hypothetical protein